MPISAIIMTPSVFGGESCSVLSPPSIQVTPVMFTNLVAFHQLTRKNFRNKSSYYMHMHMYIYISKIKINPIKSHYMPLNPIISHYIHIYIYIYHINSMKSPCFPRFFPCFTVQKKTHGFSEPRPRRQARTGHVQAVQKAAAGIDVLGTTVGKW